MVQLLEQENVPQSDGVRFNELMSENDQFFLGHMRLYKHELFKVLSDGDCAKQFFDLFDGRQREILEKMFIDQKNGNERVALLERIWKQISRDREAMNRFFSLACNRNPNLHEMVYEPISEHSLKYYEQMFSEDPFKMDKLTLTMDPKGLCEHLGDHEYKTLKESVEILLKQKKVIDASCRIMRTLPRIQCSKLYPSKWYFDFLNACQHGQINCSIPSFIDTNFKNALDQYNTEGLLMKKGSQLNGLAENVSLPLIDEEPDQTALANRTQQSYKQYRMMSDEDLERVEEAEPIELRPYQHELVEVANRGCNTIICAPTGSGKTIVAAHIILEHFRSIKTADRPYRVAMMVPTVPLVEQQCTMLNRYLRKIIWVHGVSGSEAVNENGRAPYVLASHVTVFTPQLLINLLKSIRKDDRLYFSDFTMFIFDECHHCDSDHPYNVLMRMLHECTNVKLQIVGLTASLPVGSGQKNEEAALDHMMELCARLSAHYISTVRKNVENLSDHVKPPVDEVKRAQRPTGDKFVFLVEECMTKIEMTLKKELKDLIAKKTIELRKDETAFPSHRTYNYESFIGSLKNRLSDMRGSNIKYQLIKMLEHLSYYCRALYLSDLLPNSFALKYLSQKMENVGSGQSGISGIQDELRSLFEGLIVANTAEITADVKGESKEIIRVLHQILTNQYRKEPNSRTIIFVTTRLMAQYLSNHLGSLGIVGRLSKEVGYITSCNQASSLSGQSAEEQRVMIENFNYGIVKVLVATSVAEEGLDISACNLIVKYNNTGSERTLIQRRGRARAKNSKSILLALDGSVEEKELENIHKEYLMRRCIEHMQTKSEGQMKSMVEKKIEQMRVLNESIRAQNLERKKLLDGKCFDLKCRLCGTFICRSNDMRIVCDSQYACCDPTIWERINLRVSTAKSLAIATLVGKPHCMGPPGSSCDEVLGTIVKVYGAFLPTISARAICLERKDEKRETELDDREYQAKKWDTITRERFTVEPISENDLRVMLNSLHTHSEEQHLKLEAEASLAIQRAAEEMKSKKTKRKVILDE